MRYILDHARLTEALDRYPHLLERLTQLKPSTAKSVHFPAARVEERLIFRLITASESYPHIYELLADLDHCLANGCQHPTLIRTRAGKQLSSAVSELILASYFLRKGYTVETFDDQKGNNSVPDILVSDGLPVLVGEVYQPRDWDGLELFQDDLLNRLRHLDVPWDFHSRIRIARLRLFDERKRLMTFDQWGFSEKYLDDHRRREVVDRICVALTASLKRGIQRPQTTFSDPDVNSKVTVHLISVKRAEGVAPTRRGAMSGPSYTPHSAQGLFQHLVERRIQAKLSEGQAATLGFECLRVLFVDISRLSYSEEFSDPYYSAGFSRMLTQSVDLGSYDAVVLFQRRIGVGMLFPLATYKDESVRSRIENLLNLPPSTPTSGAS